MGMADSSPSSPEAQWPALSENAFGLRRHERPRVVIKADLLPAFGALSLIALLGLPLGWVWSRLAPARRVRALPGGELAPLPMEIWHRFADIAVFMLLGLAAGVVVAVGTWFVRERRGPVMMLAAVAGSALCAFFAMRIGTALASSLYAVPEAPEVGEVLARAPSLSTAWIILAQPLSTAFVYAILTIWNGRDDLGRRLG